MLHSKEVVYLMYLSKNLHRLRSAWLISLLATMAPLILTACGGSSTPADPTTPATSPSTPITSATSSSISTNSVDIKIVENNGQYSFSPATVKIVKGTKIVWTNTTDATHTV